MLENAKSDRAKLTDIILNLRNRHIFALDLVMLSLTPALALTLRLDRLDWRAEYGKALVFYTIVALLIKIPLFYRMGLYRRYWRHADLSELTLLLAAVGLATLVLSILCLSTHAFFAQHDRAMSRSVPLIDGLLTVLFAGGFRFGVRGIYLWHRRRNGAVGGRRVLVAGAGEAGVLVIQEMRTNPTLEMEPVAFADDDPAKIGAQIEGLPVLGTCAQIPEIVARHQIQRILVAMPSAPLQRQMEITALCKSTGVATFSLPGMYELLAGHKTVSQLPKIDITRLLRRQPVELDQREIAAFLQGASVLVTGAGGSIGGELCRQIARFDPTELVLLGHGENSIFEIELDLHLSFPDLVTYPVIADVRDQARIDQVVREYRPDVIFHAAAHKHVPLMEENAIEAITNNVLGTYHVLESAERSGVRHFVLISTDKAVNPANMMGATKRLAELLVQSTAWRSGRPYMAVRFGNVLGSRGSVIPVFQRQIAAGGPLTVTHREMCRYFMTIPEAVQLVLQASALGQGGEIFVLDMGQPVRIQDLAEDMIKLAGREPHHDIKITYTGIRPGEKLHEELFLEREDYRRTNHPRIFVATSECNIQVEMLLQVVTELLDLNFEMPSEHANEQMRILLPQLCRFIDDWQPCFQPALSHPTAAPHARALGSIVPRTSPSTS